MKENNPRVAIITNILAPYRIPVFNILAGYHGLDLQVFFCAERNPDRLWKISQNKKFRYEIVPGINYFVPRMEWDIHFNARLWRLLRRYDPHVIILAGYSAPSFWLGLLFAKLSRKKVVLWSGSTLLSSRRQGLLLNGIRRLFVKSADACVAYGSMAQEFLEFYGAFPPGIFRGYNTVDIDYFQRNVEAYRARPGFAMERQGLPQTLLLYAGSLVPRKGLKETLLALRSVPSANWGLMVVGEGPCRHEFEDLAASYGLEQVSFEGFQDRESLIKYYALADIFLMPSTNEVWGLVMNEALAGGLFVLGSKSAGATHDLIRPGFNGLIIDPSNSKDYAEKIMWCLENVQELRRKHLEISSYISRFSPEQCAQALCDAVNYCLNPELCANYVSL